MQTFDATAHPRATDGKFAEKPADEPAAVVTPRTLSEDEFDEEFGHIPSKVDEGNFYVEWAEAQRYPDNQVWSAIDGDDGGIYLVPGHHAVNRFAYVISAKPRVHDDLEVCIQPGDDRCDHCGQPTDDGEGYDGKCGSCADLVEQHDQGEHAGGTTVAGCPDCDA